MFNWNESITKFYPYRRALLEGVFLRLDVTEDMQEELNKFLIKNHCRPDNHICFTLSEGIHCMLSDNVLKFSTGIREERW